MYQRWLQNRMRMFTERKQLGGNADEAMVCPLCNTDSRQDQDANKRPGTASDTGETWRQSLNESSTISRSRPVTREGPGNGNNQSRPVTRDGFRSRPGTGKDISDMRSRGNSSGKNSLFSSRSGRPGSPAGLPTVPKPLRRGGAEVEVIHHDNSIPDPVQRFVAMRSPGLLMSQSESVLPYLDSR
eukprot:CAMPEP_0182430678 /NCGR_PEP_ID=MMETSP1167-20130531/42502_1 /TAXON_ID=2988 /ORGANISM="Mallomonas Sp, Strain CCMP3275" /LENGTH=184 /DNA_ID=CAMNT_0024616053 /DNA_START=164 /DNA_END=718 /DNA_ORIENTATION=+